MAGNTKSYKVWLGSDDKLVTMVDDFAPLACPSPTAAAHLVFNGGTSHVPFHRLPTFKSELLLLQMEERVEGE